MNFLKTALGLMGDTRRIGRDIVPARLMCGLLKRPTCRVSVYEIGPFVFRIGGSDLDVLRQVFRDRQYDLSRFPQSRMISETYQRILDEGHTPILVDAGANIGAAAAYFANAFPRARILAVEPEPSNARLCRENTRRLSNVTVVEAALGANPGWVEVSSPDGRSWSFRTLRSEVGAIPIRTIAQLVDGVENGRLFAVKMDIEGFEQDVFSDNCEWLRDVTLLIVEPHDWLPGEANTSRTLQRAVASCEFDLLLSGENLVYVRSSSGSVCRH
jgi:FkbM family methyltransferase